MRKAIKTGNAPEAIGPYSQAIESNNFVFISGQLGLDPVTMQLKGDSTLEQASQAFTNVKYVLEAAGLTFENVAKAEILLTDMNDFSEVNTLYATYFSMPYPARAVYQVAALPKNAKIEIIVTATRE